MVQMERVQMQAQAMAKDQFLRLINQTQQVQLRRRLQHPKRQKLSKMQAINFTSQKTTKRRLRSTPKVITHVLGKGLC
jgi:translation elongation factor P/translation initiation factor 5A